MKKGSVTLGHQPMAWPVPYACAQPYHPGIYHHISMAQPSGTERSEGRVSGTLYCRGGCPSVSHALIDSPTSDQHQISLL